MSETPAYRTPEPGEWMPADFFSRARVQDIFATTALTGYSPLEVDLGCGEGRFLTEIAAEYPDRCFLGVERLLGRVKKSARRARQAGLENVRLLRLEGAYAVEYLLPHHSVDRLHLLFPDPWPKKKHHGRRMLRREFLPILARLLKPGGELLFKTDHEEYFAWAREEVADSGWAELSWEDGDFPYPTTDFEALWTGQGKPIYRLRLRSPDV